MQATDFIWFNGKLVPWQEANVHVLSHTLHYGGGAFEGIRFYNTSTGPAIFKLSEHIDRLLYSANVLEMMVPYTNKEICTAVIELVAANQLPDGYIRPLVFYGYGKMGVNPIGSPVELAIACWPWGAYLAHESVDVKTSSYIRIHPESTDVRAKICGHYVNSMLASLELKNTHYHEALLLESNGFIAEGVGENFFMVKAGVIYTPKLGAILPGITRATIIKLARELGFSVVETDIPLAEAYSADEAFFTGTAVEVTPIRSLDDRLLQHQGVGPVAEKIKIAYMDVVHGRNPEYLHCLTRVG